MSILENNRHFFSMLTRERGNQYCNNGRVHIDQADDVFISAQVQGSEIYDVEIAWRDGFLGVSCTCPYAEENYCNHIYAVLLMIERSNLMKSFRKHPHIRIKLIPPDDLPADGLNCPEQRWKMPPQKHRGPPLWALCLDDIRNTFNLFGDSAAPVPTDAKKEIVYVLSQASGGYQPSAAGDLAVNISSRGRKKNGEWGKTKPVNISTICMSQLEHEDAKIISMLSGAKSPYDYSRSYYGSFSLMLSRPLAEVVLPAMSVTGRLFSRNDWDETLLGPLTWHADEVWTPVLSLIPDDSGEHYSFSAGLQSSSGAITAAEPSLMTRQGIMIIGKRVCRLDDLGAFPWIEHLRKQGRLEIPRPHIRRFIERLYSLPGLPPLAFPEELRVSEVSADAQTCLVLRTQESHYYCQEKKKFRASLYFLYRNCPVAAFPRARGFYAETLGCYLLRNAGAEENACRTLLDLGFKTAKDTGDEATHEIDSGKFTRVVSALTAQGWRIEADGKLYREAGSFSLNVTTGIDWFELRGECEFENQKARLPALLAALKKKESLIELSDGTFGVIPADVLKKYAFLAGMGETHDGHVRFRKSQAGLLDALLAAQPEITCDALFENTRRQLQNFCGIEPSAAPASFQGALRRYQEEGLGWFDFLRQFGYGGCLADDMGLGKTVQVLALLEKRRLLRLYETRQSWASTEAADSTAAENNGGVKPSLVVAPRSIIFNWQKEAARFTPGLRVLDHTGLARRTGGDHFENYDLVLTTYGTLRRDAAAFRDIEFDYVILDEAQAIKNAETVSAKAVRLLKAKHRLALSGTPIENHLSELWSLFEFLNPGLLGSASVFKRMSADADAASPETRTLLARALKPFILRRTKTLVAPELPQKTEQVVYCEMDKTQAKLYNELRDHYRLSLLKQIDEQGIGKSKMHVLEALLRLRQAACHPGLLDPKWRSGASAKTEFLLPQLAEIFEEGHKALIFSQFTSFLSIVKKQLDDNGYRYLYLDGKIRNREQLVRAFQEDDEAQLFLISLRAGGLGLNLTAAEYVYLLDPWWNPAVEAQAVDRTHRIGQTQQVFAYRLITRHTVEERVLELQQSKRDLFAALIREDAGLLRSLNREDLEILLS